MVKAFLSRIGTVLRSGVNHIRKPFPPARRPGKRSDGGLSHPVRQEGRRAFSWPFNAPAQSDHAAISNAASALARHGAERRRERVRAKAVELCREMGRDVPEALA